MRARRESQRIIHPCANTWKWPDNSFVCLNRCRPPFSLTRGNFFFFSFFFIQLLCLKRHQRKRKKFSAAPWVMKGFLIFSAEDSERAFARYVGFRLFLIDLGQSWKWHKYHEGSGPRKLSSKLCCRPLSEYEAQVFLGRSSAVSRGGWSTGRNGHRARTNEARSRERWLFFCFFSPPGQFATLLCVIISPSHSSASLIYNLKEIQPAPAR